MCLQIKARTSRAKKHIHMQDIPCSACFPGNKFFFFFFLFAYDKFIYNNKQKKPSLYMVVQGVKYFGQNVE